MPNLNSPRFNELRSFNNTNNDPNFGWRMNDGINSNDNNNDNNNRNGSDMELESRGQVKDKPNQITDTKGMSQMIERDDMDESGSISSDSSDNSQVSKSSNIAAVDDNPNLTLLINALQDDKFTNEHRQRIHSSKRLCIFKTADDGPCKKTLSTVLSWILHRAGSCILQFSQ